MPDPVKWLGAQPTCSGSIRIICLIGGHATWGPVGDHTWCAMVSDLRIERAQKGFSESDGPPGEPALTGMRCEETGVVTAGTRSGSAREGLVEFAGRQ